MFVAQKGPSFGQRQHIVYYNGLQKVLLPDNVVLEELDPDRFPTEPYIHCKITGENYPVESYLEKHGLVGKA
jgi:hypothetical protein